MFRADRAHSGAAYGRGRNARNVMDLGGVQHVALRRPETLKVGGGQWIVGSLDRFTIHCPLPTTHYFRRSPSCRSRRPERMKRAPRNVRQASSLSGMPAMGDSPSPRQAGSLSDIFGGGKTCKRERFHANNGSSSLTTSARSTRDGLSLWKLSAPTSATRRKPKSCRW